MLLNSLMIIFVHLFTQQLFIECLLGTILDAGDIAGNNTYVCCPQRAFIPVEESANK